MSIYEQLIEIYPELIGSDVFSNNIIVLQNDSDGLGDFIVKWDYDKPLPKGFKVGK